MTEPRGCLLFDWGDTIMRVLPGVVGPMHTWPKVEAVVGVAATLGELRNDWLLAIATNAASSQSADIRAALRRVQLDGYFSRIYCYRGIGYRKPAAEFFAHILRDVSLPASRVVMIGDDLEGDVLGAVHCGLSALWFNEHSDERRSGKGYDTFHDFRELPQALARLALPGAGQAQQAGG